MRIAITGAGGKTGQHVVRALIAAGHEVHALVHDVSHRGRLPDETITSVGDQRDPYAVAQLTDACGALYHIPPNMSPDELVMAEAAIAACTATGTPRLVYHSVLHPQIEAMPHHWSKLRVEERLLTSGLETVVLQPAPYLQNLIPYVERVRRGRPPDFPYGPHVTLSMVHLADVGEAAAVVVAGGEHDGATYQLCSGERFTQGEAWAALTASLGLDAPYTSIPVEAWRDGVAGGLPGRAVDWLAAMFDLYDRHGLRGSSLPLRTLLGREPRRLADLARDLTERT